MKLHKKIEKEKYYKKVIFEERPEGVIYYIRDEESELIGLEVNDQVYLYKKNLQGDIIGIYDSNYDLVVNYKYDSWGNIISITDNNGNEITDNNNIGLINPFRYRSYYYDNETKLYYLNNRYYNPLWGRFVNADGIIGTNNKMIYDLYTYCDNNPIIMIDSEGKFVTEAIVIGIGIGIGIGILVGIYLKDDIIEATTNLINNIVDAVDTAIDTIKDNSNDENKKKKYIGMEK